MPFDGSSAGEICGLTVHQQPLTPAQVNANLTAGLEGVIGKALEKDAICAISMPLIYALTCSG